jgi:hypothetical protein
LIQNINMPSLEKTVKKNHMIKQEPNKMETDQKMEI